MLPFQSIAIANSLCSPLLPETDSPNHCSTVALPLLLWMKNRMAGTGLSGGGGAPDKDDIWWLCFCVSRDEQNFHFEKLFTRSQVLFCSPEIQTRRRLEVEHGVRILPREYLCLPPIFFACKRILCAMSRVRVNKVKLILIILITINKLCRGHQRLLFLAGSRGHRHHHYPWIRGHLLWWLLDLLPLLLVSKWRRLFSPRTYSHDSFRVDRAED